MKEIELYRHSDISQSYDLRFLDDAQADTIYQALLDAWKGGQDFFDVVDGLGRAHTIRLNILEIVTLRDYNEPSEKFAVEWAVFQKQGRIRMERAIVERTNGEIGFR
jgi:hypothetical protein